MADVHGSTSGMSESSQVPTCQEVVLLLLLLLSLRHLKV